MNEFAHNFGAITASVQATYSIDGTFKGNPNVPTTARIMYAIVRNNSAGSLTVTGSKGNSTIGIGERKRVEMAGGSRFFTILPAATVNSGEVTADVGIEGCKF